VKNFKNWLLFVKDMDSYIVGRFFETQCSSAVYYIYKIYNVYP